MVTHLNGDAYLLMKENNNLEQLQQQQGYQKYIDNFKKLNTDYDNSYEKYLEKWQKDQNETIIPWDNNESVPWTDGNYINPLDLETNPWKPSTTPVPYEPNPKEQEEYRKLIEEILKKKEKKRVVEIKCAECGKTIAIIKRKPSDDTDEKLLCPVCYKLKKLKE